MLIKMDKSISNIYNQELSDLQIKNVLASFKTIDDLYLKNSLSKRLPQIKILEGDISLIGEYKEEFLKIRFDEKHKLSLYIAYQDVFIPEKYRPLCSYDLINRMLKCRKCRKLYRIYLRYILKTKIKIENKYIREYEEEELSLL